MKCDTCDFLSLCRYRKAVVNDFYFKSDIMNILTEKSKSKPNKDAHSSLSEAIFDLLDYCGRYRERKEK